METDAFRSETTAPGKRGSVRLQFYLRRDVAKKIEHVGNVLGQPTGKAAAFLLDGASDCERQAGDLLSACVRERRDEAQVDRPPVVRLFGAPPEEVVLLQVPLAVDVAERIGRIAREQALPRAKACAGCSTGRWTTRCGSSTSSARGWSRPCSSRKRPRTSPGWRPSRANRK